MKLALLLLATFVSVFSVANEDVSRNKEVFTGEVIIRGVDMFGSGQVVEDTIHFFLYPSDKWGSKVSRQVVIEIDDRKYPAELYSEKNPEEGLRIDRYSRSIGGRQRFFSVYLEISPETLAAILREHTSWRHLRFVRGNRLSFYHSNAIPVGKPFNFSNPVFAESGRFEVKFSRFRSREGRWPKSLERH